MKLESRSAKGGRPSKEVASRLGNHILEVALTAYCDHGLDGVALADIAKSAGVSKKTLYSRFENRDALLLAAIQHGIETIATPLSDSLPDGAVRDRLIFIGSTMARLSIQEPVVRLERLLAAVAERRPAVYQRMIDSIQSARLSLITAVLSSAAERGEINVPNMQIVAAILFDAMITHPRRMLLGSRPEQNDWAAIEAHVLEALDVVLFGILRRDSQLG